ncbi:MAG: FMN-binding protein [Candidatus Omnitrophica bacterium]|nr:FMN-binding protein [Candidatus Omnitrophota bacterium]
MAAVKRSLFAAAGLMTFLFFTPFQFFNHVFFRYILRQNVSAVFDIPSIYAQILSSVEEALRVFMPDAVSFVTEDHRLSVSQFEIIQNEAEVSLDPELDREFRFIAGKNNSGEIIGYAAQDHVRGKWGLIHYMIAFDLSGRVKDVMVLEYQEKRGRPVAKRRFLRQFIGKNTGHDIRLMKDIRGITGASISSNGMTNGIRKMVHVFKLFYGK